MGGLAAGAGNTIAYNAAAGVMVGASTVTILRNSIFNNGPNTSGSQEGLGIDLTPGGPGVTPNDAGDADTGPNGYQNFPILTSVSVATGKRQYSPALSIAARAPPMSLNFSATTRSIPLAMAKAVTFSARPMLRPTRAGTSRLRRWAFLSFPVRFE